MTIPGESILFLLFGLPTWALVDGTWSSLSQLAESSPEGYGIAAWLIFSLSLGNVFPLILGYTLEKSQSPEILKRCIYMIMVLGFIAGMLMGVFWKETFTIQSNNYSVPLLMLFFIVGACSSSSNVVHYMFASSFHASHTSFLGTGMGLGSMISGLLGILQGTWLIDYGFSTTSYYITLSLLYIPAGISFYYLQKKRELMRSCDDAKDKKPLLLHSQPFSVVASVNTIEGSFLPTHCPRERQFSINPARNRQRFFSSFYHILLLQCCNSVFGYGISPAFVSYACSKFPDSNTILLFATGLGAIIDPVCKFATNYYRFSTFPQLLLGSCFVFLFSFGLIICSVLPRNSSFYNSDIVGMIPILCYTGCNGLFGFTNLSVFRYFKEDAFLITRLDCVEDDNNDNGGETEDDSDKKKKTVNDFVQIMEEHEDPKSLQIRNAYRYCGLAIQLGSLIGSIIAFTLVVSEVL
jgi:hypothetical protein